MTRFITTTLTLVLTAGLSSSDVSAQDALGISMANTAEGGLSEISGIVIRFAATELGIIDPDDCPQLGGQEGEDIMGLWQDCNNYDGLWFRLLDAGYTEDEAFEMIELTIIHDKATKQDTIN